MTKSASCTDGSANKNLSASNTWKSKQANTLSNIKHFSRRVTNKNQWVSKIEKCLMLILLYIFQWYNWKMCENIYANNIGDIFTQKQIMRWLKQIKIYGKHNHDLWSPHAFSSAVNFAFLCLLHIYDPALIVHNQSSPSRFHSSYIHISNFTYQDSMNLDRSALKTQDKRESLQLQLADWQLSELLSRAVTTAYKIGTFHTDIM